MEVFVYCRDRDGAGPLRKQLVQTHWAFMDGYAASMIARGPTLAEDGSQTGSMHILDLPDLAAARAFAFEEPYYRAGVFADVTIHRWRNALGRTMWDFQGDPDRNRRFLVIGHGHAGMTAQREQLLEAHRRYFIDRGYQEHFIARGPLLSDDGAHWIGSAMLIELPDAAAVAAMFADEPYHRNGLYARMEILPWRFGGRH